MPNVSDIKSKLKCRGTAECGYCTMHEISRQYLEQFMSCHLDKYHLYFGMATLNCQC